MVIQVYWGTEIDLDSATVRVSIEIRSREEFHDIRILMEFELYDGTLEWLVELVKREKSVKVKPITHWFPEWERGQWVRSLTQFDLTRRGVGGGSQGSQCFGTIIMVIYKRIRERRIRLGSSVNFGSGTEWTRKLCFIIIVQKI